MSSLTAPEFVFFLLLLELGCFVSGFESLNAARGFARLVGGRLNLQYNVEYGYRKWHGHGNALSLLVLRIGRLHPLVLVWHFIGAIWWCFGCSSRFLLTLFWSMSHPRKNLALTLFRQSRHTPTRQQDASCGQPKPIMSGGATDRLLAPMKLASDEGGEQLYHTGQRRLKFRIPRLRPFFIPPPLPFLESNINLV